MLVLVEFEGSSARILMSHGCGRRQGIIDARYIPIGGKKMANPGSLNPCYNYEHDIILYILEYTRREI